MWSHQNILTLKKRIYFQRVHTVYFAPENKDKYLIPPFIVLLHELHWPLEVRPFSSWWEANVATWSQTLFLVVCVCCLFLHRPEKHTHTCSFPHTWNPSGDYAANPSCMWPLPHALAHLQPQSWSVCSCVTRIQFLPRTGRLGPSPRAGNATRPPCAMLLRPEDNPSRSLTGSSKREADGHLVFLTLHPYGSIYTYRNISCVQILLSGCGPTPSSPPFFIPGYLRYLTETFAPVFRSDAVFVRTSVRTGERARVGCREGAVVNMSAHLSLAFFLERRPNLGWTSFEPPILHKSTWFHKVLRASSFACVYAIAWPPAVISMRSQDWSDRGHLA